MSFGNEWRRSIAATRMRLAALYAEDAVNHQVVFEPTVGRSAIHEMFRREFAAAEMVCLPEQILEDGEWAVLEWRDPMGLRGCGFFRIVDGLIRFQRGYLGSTFVFAATRIAATDVLMIASEVLLASARRWR